MSLTILTPTLQSWQIAGWVDQGYRVKSLVEGFEGEVVSVYPGNITLDGGIGKLITVKEIPTQKARLEDPFVIVGED